MSVLIHVKTLKTTTPLVWLQGLKRNNKYSMGDAWFKRYTSGLEPPRFPLPVTLTLADTYECCRRGYFKLAASYE